MLGTESRVSRVSWTSHVCIAPVVIEKLRSSDEVLPSLPLDLRLPDALCLGPRVESAESPGHPMSASLLLSLKSCDDPALVGGKAAGLGWLLRNGFSVPPGSGRRFIAPLKTRAAPCWTSGGAGLLRSPCHARSRRLSTSN